MERFKLLVSNFFVYGLGGTISKIIPLIMLPIVTRIMPNTTYFGLNDIYSVVVSFGSSLAIMGMYDALFRMFFEKSDEEYQKGMCSSALGFTLMTSLIIFIVLIIFKGEFSNIFFGDSNYKNLVSISAVSILVGATNCIVSAPTRINNQRKVYLLANFLSPIISYCISIPLLLHGLYIVALPIAGIIAAFSTEIIFYSFNRKWFSFKLIKWKYIKNMLIIGLPLVPNFLIYWVFNSSDKLMISHLLDNSAVGLYGIGSRIGQISQLIYTAFASGWQYFAFSTMHDDDQVEMVSEIFEYIAIISLSSGMIMATFGNVIFKILFTQDYLGGAIVVPYLFLSPLLLMLFQINCNQFLIIKKSWPSMLVLMLGMCVNILANFYLIPIWGIEGAAVGTLFGYLVSVVISCIVLRRMNLLKLSKRFIIYIFVVIIFFALWRFVLLDSLIKMFLSLVIVYIFTIILYKKSLIKLINLIKRSLKLYR